MDERYGDTPPWHDVQLEARGPALGDLAVTFRERWDDPTPLDHRNPWRARIASIAREPRRPEKLPPLPATPPPVGHQAVQVLRTYPAKRPPFPFAPDGRDRVVVCDLENDEGTPVYVHAKACIVDDVWATVGSDNLNLRSWTHDSELSCAVIDEARDERTPTDPAGLGDGARVFARQLRLRLTAEHLGRSPEDPDLVDPVSAFEAWRHATEALDRWHREGRQGPRPPGRVRPHPPARVPPWATWWARGLYRFVVDPDGRPRALRGKNDF